MAFALLLGSALVTVPDATAMRVSEFNKLFGDNKAEFINDVMKDHIKVISEKDVALSKETIKYLLTKTDVNGVSQGFIDLIGLLQYVTKNNAADKTDVEAAFRLLLDVKWKNGGLTHNDQPATTSMFFPKGYQVIYNPTKKDADAKVAQNPPATESNTAAEK